jgi:hypothetical protein
MISYSKNAAARSLRSRTASIICGLLSLVPLADVAFADANAVAMKKLDDATSRLQNMVISMSMGCGGGPHGVPPVNWGNLQPHGNAAVNSLTAAHVSLAQSKTADALQQISAAEPELDALVNGIHNNCSGGCCGIDPTYFASYLATRDVVKQELGDVRDFLGG